MHIREKRTKKTAKRETATANAGMDGEKPQQHHERYDATQLRAERSAEPRAGKYCESSVEPAARAAEEKKRRRNARKKRREKEKKKCNKGGARSRWVVRCATARYATAFRSLLHT